MTNRTLRERFQFGERENFYKSLVPKGPNIEPDDFRKGLGLEPSSFEQVELMITTAFEGSGLTDLDSFTDPDAIIKFNACTLEPINTLVSIIIKPSKPPKWFIELWVREIMEALWRKKVDALDEQKEMDGKDKEQANGVLEAAPAVQRRSSKRIPTQLGLQHMTFALTLKDVADKIICIEQIPAKGVLIPGKPDVAASYSFKAFYLRFQTLYNQRFGTSASTVTDGTFGYSSRSGSFKTVAKQEHFEVALVYLFKNHGTSNKLRFIHHAETVVSKNTKAAVAKAQERAKASRQPTPGKVPSSAPPEVSASLRYHDPNSFSSRMRHGISNARGGSDRQPKEEVLALPPGRALRHADKIPVASSASRNKPLPATPAKDRGKSAITNKPLPAIPTSGIPTKLSSKTPGRHSPPPLVKAGIKAWQRGNKSRPDEEKVPTLSGSESGSIRRGGTPRESLRIDPIELPKKAPVVQKAGSGPKNITVLPTRPVRPRKALPGVPKAGGSSKIPKAGATEKKLPPLPKQEVEAPEISVFATDSPPGKRNSFIERAVNTVTGKVIDRIGGDYDGPSTGPVYVPVSPNPPPTPRKRAGSIALTRTVTAISKPPAAVASGIKKTLGGLVRKRPKYVETPAERFARQDAAYPKYYTEVERRTYKLGGEDFVDEREFKALDRQVGAEEGSEEDPEENENLDNAEEYIVGKFKKMQNMSKLEQAVGDVPMGLVDTSRWEECCTLFNLDPAKTDINERVHIVGLKTPLYQYQLFAVYWQMHTGRVFGGGFVADEMGLGKTLTFLAYIVVERQLAILWQEIEKARSLYPGSYAGTHLGVLDWEPNDVCPSAVNRPAGWIKCPCASSSITHQIFAKPGIRLAVVPPALVPTWIQQWNNHIDETKLGLRLIVGHDGSNEKSITGGYGNRDVRHPANVKLVKAKVTLLEKKRDLINGAKYAPEKAELNQERLLLLTTGEYLTKVFAPSNAYQGRLKIDPDNPESKWGPVEKRGGVLYGIAMSDECHEDWHKNKGRSGVLASLPNVGRPWVWGYSGTPLTDTPRCLEGIVSALESHSELRYAFSWKNLDNICKDFDVQAKKGVTSPKAAAAVLERFRPFLEKLMIRRTAESSSFGHSLIKLPPHIHQDVTLAHKTTYDGMIANLSEVVDIEVELKLRELQTRWDDAVYNNQPRAENRPTKLSFNTLCRVQWRLRLLATFPFLVSMADVAHPDHVDFTNEEGDAFRGKNEKLNPYAKNLRLITENSAKIMWLYNFIGKIDKEKDVNGQEQKVVIMTHFNPVAMILKLWIEKYVQGKTDRVGIVYPGMRARDRNAVIEAFTDAKDAKGLRKQKANYQFLVGTTRLIGAGLQLTCACNVIMMEPDYNFFRELQGYARVHRIGQKNLESRSYRLIDAGSEIEQRIVKRQEVRNELVGMEVKEISPKGMMAGWDRFLDDYTGDGPMENAILEQVPEQGAGSSLRPAPLVVSKKDVEPDLESPDLYNA